MKTTSKLFIAPVAFALFGGCAGHPADPGAQAPGGNNNGNNGGAVSKAGGNPAANGTDSQGAAGSVSTATIPGYRHTLDKSRFATGQPITSISEGRFAGVRGPEGGFSTKVSNGLTMGLSSFDSQALKEPEMFKLAKDHNDHVLNYFVAAGLPKDQVGVVRATDMGSGDGLLSEEVATKDALHEAYYSVVTRQIEGIPVEESYAWARFNKKGQSVMEAVYWPALPASVVAEARALKAALEDPVKGGQIRGQLPQGMLRVQIRHTPSSMDQTPVAMAIYNVLLTNEGGDGYARHFDKDLKEVRLPAEARPIAKGVGPSEGAADPSLQSAAQINMNVTEKDLMKNYANVKGGMKLPPNVVPGGLK